ncbi:MAG: hypothetical protein DRO04_00095 [Candidatus Iainarchaeum archaeon]|uniref:Uncharacterized protein n=1 Tax=Candidatus Iainarchaeum sp. TaxID=3101447 RepID=A0A497JIH4_9ARCH|nr:MAG: hypothetical protein DRO04_00095 [Candidatus Diapherotrites archaeon]
MKRIGSVMLECGDCDLLLEEGDRVRVWVRVEDIYDLNEIGFDARRTGKAYLVPVKRLDDGTGCVELDFDGEVKVLD